jgi:hypothetical protein
MTTTAVTCFFPVGGRAAGLLEGGERLMRLPQPLVAFVDPRYADRVRARRAAHGLEALTRVVPTAFEDLRIARWGPTIDGNRARYWPTRDARAPRDVHIITTSRFALVHAAARWNPFGTTHFCQVDFNMLSKRPHGSTQYTDEAVYGKLAEIFRRPRPGCTVLAIEHWEPEAFDDLRAFFAAYRYQVSGMFWTIEGGAVADRVLPKATEVVEDFIRAGYGHGDEHALARTADLLPEDFSYSLGDYQDAVDNYFRPTANPERVRRVLESSRGSDRHGAFLEYCAAAGHMTALK